MHLTFLPDRGQGCFFLWGRAAPAAPLATVGTAATARLLDDALESREVVGLQIPILEALPELAAMTGVEMDAAPASVTAWSLAAKLALDLVARERIVPRVTTRDGRTEAGFEVAPALPDDAARMSALAAAFPPAAHAVPIDVPPRTAGRKRGRAAARVWSPETLLRSFLDASADALVRQAHSPASRGRRGAPGSPHVAWERRFVGALSGGDTAFVVDGFRERTLLADLDAWVEPVRCAGQAGPRACFRLELPSIPDAGLEDDTAPTPVVHAGTFPLRFLLQAADDPSLLVPAGEFLRGGRRAVRRLGVQAAHRTEERLLRGLAGAARLFPPIERGLRTSHPDGVELTPVEAHAFITDAAAALGEAGFGVLLPTGLTQAGRRRLRLRMRVGAGAKGPAGAVAGASGLSLDSMLRFEWEAALAGEAISARDLSALARLKAPLVRFRGEWVLVDRDEIEQARRFLAEGGGGLAAASALSATLGGTLRHPATRLPVEVVAEGDFAALVGRLREQTTTARRAVAPTADFHGRLRPYQKRGLAWLADMADLGLGACLADDMGLGKTVQYLAWLLHRRRAAPGDTRPALLVCPTSVIGNWEHEAARFAPTLPVVRHYGVGRAASAKTLQDTAGGALVLTTYGLLRRDAKFLAEVSWAAVALDEAQNIKNAAAHTARAARALRAGSRVALTGTPVENRLAELWSISEFLNPRLLGPLDAFRRDIAAPIERHGREDVADTLRRVVRPFILRRLKSDPAILRDLPPKQEMKIVCTLTREQGSLYQAVVTETMARIEAARGIARRGLVLALITALKQICNHPAQYLGEAGPLPGRSGKLQRLREMMEEVIAAGDRALVFTQFRAMGDRLVDDLRRGLGVDVAFLHGGVARAARDAMVRAFQEDPHGPRIFVLSVRAGGTGLNLTAASHVFHFDRWWNPAVEDQATDRAHRIGQKRSVQVHKFLCAGTVEEKVDLLLEKKRNLASRIVGGGEQWITELDDAGLRDLFSLATDAVIGAEMADEEATGASGAGAVRRPGRAGAGRRRQAARTGLGGGA